MSELFLKGITCTIILFLTLVLLAVAKNGGQGTDLTSFYTGALIVRNNEGRFLYDEKTQEKYQKHFLQNLSIKLLPYRNLPFLTLFFIPFTLFSFDNAYLLMGFLNMVVFLFIGYLSRKVFTNIEKPIFFLLALLLYWPVIQNFILGQISLFLALIFLLVYYFIKKNRYFLAGLFLGLVFIKIQYLLVVPFLFLAVRKKNFLVGFSAAFLIIFIVNFFISGLLWLRDYPYFIFKTETVEYGSRFWHMYSLNSSFKLAGIGGKSEFINLFLYTLFLVFFAFRRKSIGFDKGFVLATVSAILFSIHSLPHDLTILIVPVFILLNKNRWFSALVLFFVPFTKELGLIWSAGLILFLFNLKLFFTNYVKK